MEEVNHTGFSSRFGTQRCTAKVPRGCPLSMALRAASYVSSYAPITLPSAKAITRPRYLPEIGVVPIKVLSQVRLLHCHISPRFPFKGTASPQRKHEHYTIIFPAAPKNFSHVHVFGHVLARASGDRKPLLLHLSHPPRPRRGGRRCAQAPARAALPETQPDRSAPSSRRRPCSSPRSPNHRRPTSRTRPRPSAGRPAPPPRRSTSWRTCRARPSSDA